MSPTTAVNREAQTTRFAVWQNQWDRSGFIFSANQFDTDPFDLGGIGDGELEYGLGQINGHGCRFMVDSFRRRLIPNPLKTSGA